jgi:post-segregation antitoxin (ccd killing protein)
MAQRVQYQVANLNEVINEAVSPFRNVDVKTPEQYHALNAQMAAAAQAAIAASLQSHVQQGWQLRGIEEFSYRFGRTAESSTYSFQLAVFEASAE